MSSCRQGEPGKGGEKGLLGAPGLRVGVAADVIIEFDPERILQLPLERFKKTV